MKKTTGHGSKSERQKEEAILALLTHRNVEEAARAVGIGATTLQRWLKNPEFAVQYREARRTAFLQSIARLQQASSAAASTLLKMMVDPLTTDAVRLRAADRVLEHSRSGMETEDLDARVLDLEHTRSVPYQSTPVSEGEDDDDQTESLAAGEAAGGPGPATIWFADQDC